MQLRKYQEEAIQAMLNYKGRGGLVILPTGAGKSVVVQEISKLFKKTLIVAPRQILVKQYEDKYKLPSICYNSLPKVELSTFDLVLFDEAHFCSKHGRWFKAFQDYQGQYFGLTATPYRDNDDMILKDKFFSEIIYHKEVYELTKDKFLTPLEFMDMTEYADYLRHFAKINPNNLGKEGDIICDFLEEVYKREGQNGVILVFLPLVDVCQQIGDRLTSRGYSCKTVHSKADKSVDNVELYDFCLNVNILTTGFDLPSLRTIVIATKTESINKYFQILGRGTRLAEGKETCKVYDCSFTYRGIEEYSYSMKMEDCVAFVDKKLTPCANKKCNNKFLDKLQMRCDKCGTLSKHARGLIEGGAVMNEAQDALIVPPYSIQLSKEEIATERCQEHDAPYKWFGMYTKRCNKCFDIYKKPAPEEKEVNIVGVDTMVSEEWQGNFVVSIKRAKYDDKALQVTFFDGGKFATYGLFPPYHHHTKHNEASRQIYKTFTALGLEYKTLIERTQGTKVVKIDRRPYKLFVRQNKKGLMLVNKVFDSLLDVKG